MFFDVYSKLCKEKGLSPSAAAVKMGINKGTVSVWKNKGTTPQTAQLQKIASYFGVSVDYLLEKEKAPAKESERADMEEQEAEPILSNVYFNFAKYAENNEIDPEDIKAAIELIEKLKNK